MTVANIRPIRRSDLVTVIDIQVGGSLHPDAEDPTKVDAYWRGVDETRRAGGDVFVAEVEQEVVGFYQLLVFRHFQHAGSLCAEVESVHVRASDRGRGIGSAMMAHATEEATRRNCYRLQLTSNNVRGDAHRFYLSNGFTQSHQGFKKPLS